MQRSVPKLLSEEKVEGKYPTDWAVLSNHWSVKVYMAREQVRSVCQRILAAIGIPETEWCIEEEAADSVGGK